MNEIAVVNKGADWRRLKSLVLDSVSSRLPSASITSAYPCRALNMEFSRSLAASIIGSNSGLAS